MRSLNPLGFMPSDDNDIKPTRTIRFTKSKKAFKKLTKISRKRFIKESVPLGRALNPDELEQMHLYSVFDIPDDAVVDPDAPAEPNFHKDPPKRSKAPEDDAMSRFEFDNVVEVSDAKVKSILNTISEMTEETSDVLYNEILAPFVAFDNARGIVQAVMRDNLGIKGKIDNSVSVALDDISKLALVSCVMGQMVSIDDTVKQNYLITLSDLLAANTVEQMKKNNKAEAYSAVLQSLVSKQTQGDVDADKKPMAALRSRSKPPNKPQ